MPVLLQGEAISLIDLIETTDRSTVSNGDRGPVVDRNLVTIAAASEALDELEPPII